LRKAPDVRTVLEERYKIRQTLKNAKLIWAIYLNPSFIPLGFWGFGVLGF
jgi:hypothetical protein